MSLLVKEEIKSPWTILHLKGKLDVTNSSQLEEVFHRCFHEGKSDIAIDFEELTYLSSSGIRILLAQHKKFIEQNRRFVLCRIPAHILEIIELAGFDRVFFIQKTLSDLK